MQHCGDFEWWLSFFSPHTGQCPELFPPVLGWWTVWNKFVALNKFLINITVPYRPIHLMRSDQRLYFSDCAGTKHKLCGHFILIFVFCLSFGEAVASACRHSVVDFQSAQSLIRVSSASCVYAHVHLTSSGKRTISEALQVPVVKRDFFKMIV